jgi:hypothetical protein
MWKKATTPKIANKSGGTVENFKCSEVKLLKKINLRGNSEYIKFRECPVGLPRISEYIKFRECPVGLPHISEYIKFRECPVGLPHISEYFIFPLAI